MTKSIFFLFNQLLVMNFYYYIYIYNFKLEFFGRCSHSPFFLNYKYNNSKFKHINPCNIMKTNKMIFFFFKYIKRNMCFVTFTFLISSGILAYLFIFIFFSKCVLNFEILKKK